ncbi:DNA cytosine methyltransferase [Solwaraspora sp. WMMD791]|uniref:DNA cytosine methyltransferase n=1 Tax=Solwaraspora sp. WMMD791 TaxID=3016086 RepID=UPI00249B9339|nr:DNA cytosine methyltransferase [Solwaraspora sp. WMMD791]WFE27796.1 DNA cytosine methyltransferase [Solwaraspora sp. WMMD791]
MLTITDLFCGAGGSSSGAVQVPGVRVRMAANHWRLAVDTHNTNHPDADHDCADISQTDPRRYPATDILWASPECTNHSQARGARRADRQPDLFDPGLPDDAAERSRATMWDVCRFVEAMKLRGRPYRAFVVENVVDVRQWMYYDAWVTALRHAGYCLHFVYLNSMFAQAMGDGAPQSRNRWYGLGHLDGDRCPDLDRWTRPQAWCPHCDRTVRAVQAWKRPDSPWGCYRQQYVYRCPTPRCHTELHPRVLPAAAAIDWTLPGERIGDRTRPLAAKTVARIEAGLKRYATPPFLTLLRSDRPRTVAVDQPLATIVADGSNHAMVGATGDAEALVVPMRANNTAKPAAVAPLDTVTAAGNHHALVMRNMTARGDQGQMSTPTTEPLRTQTASSVQSLIRFDHLLVPYYSNGAARPVNQPAGTITTVDRNALVSAEITVDDCTFRMLEPHEIQAAMAFDTSYQVLGNKRERVRQLGNAVTPPAARDLIAALVESITGEHLDPTPTRL